ncbi:hypothetical protein TRP8649_01301 [Pelagimonas phthalicica]|uniref:Uncharacterized protein n=1 Tax=Pelagimonas phthalicica TaxID=1037362 RepID=A0A238J9E0_9RHOB|nr:hypothetical protein [Pelagimonas phthalicica]TDS94274.1 hypothetical protein CLV87_0771 [Pelagimonas phthalicica]SMX27199.1 hypothetical protein TRP8649_01301 [Pelagimonas phthalicica]
MNSQENKLLIKIGKHFEANASGNVAVGAVVVIALTLVVVGFSFI